METEQKLIKMRDDLKAKLKAVKKQIKELNSKPTDGWRTSIGSSRFMAYLKDGVYIFGITSDDKWKNETFNVDYESEFDRLVTPEESNKILTEFVNGLGYVKGAIICDVRSGVGYIPSENNVDFRTQYDEHDYCIFMNGVMIWSSVKGWAKIIEQPKFKVELKRREASGLTVVEISHGSNVDSDQLVKEIETVLNSKK